MKLLAARAQKFSTAHLVIKKAPLPDAELRSTYQALVRRYREHMAHSAVLLEGDGFWASAVRAFLTGVEMVDRRTRSKTFGKIAALAEWLAPVHSVDTGEQVDPEELRLALEWMMARPTVREHRGAYPK
jgi:hypothetical protein